MEAIKLSNRLLMNASMVTKGSKVADIGCDHAYVSIWLLQNNIAAKVIALDVNEGPVNRAKENIRKYGFQEQIEVRLSNGTQNIELGEVDCLMIAGMGGMLIVDILTAKEDLTKSCQELVLQAQSDIHIVRNCIRNLGFVIVKEDMVKEDGKYYTAIHAINSNSDIPKEKDLFDYYGKYLLENKNAVLLEMLKNLCEKYELALEQASVEGKNTLENKLHMIKEALSYYGM